MPHSLSCWPCCDRLRNASRAMFFHYRENRHSPCTGSKLRDQYPANTCQAGTTNTPIDPAHSDRILARTLNISSGNPRCHGTCPVHKPCIPNPRYLVYPRGRSNRTYLNSCPACSTPRGTTYSGNPFSSWTCKNHAHIRDTRAGQARFAILPVSTGSSSKLLANLDTSQENTPYRQENFSLLNNNLGDTRCTSSCWPGHA